MLFKTPKSIYYRLGRASFSSLVMPLFEYADLIWGDKHNVTLMSSLQALQNKAAKIILHWLLYSSASHALATLKWIPLEKRRFQWRCVHIYKCLNELITHILTLETQQHQHNYNTRNKVNLRLPCVKRNWGKRRTAYHTVNDLNSLREMIRDSTNIFLSDRFIIFYCSCFINFIFLVLLDMLVFIW